MNPILIAALFGFGLGSLIGYNVEHIQVVKMERDIVQLKLNAEKQLSEITKRINKEILDNINLNSEKDKLHEEHKQTTIALHNELKSIKLREPRCRKSSGNPLPNSTNTGESKETSADTFFTKRLHGFLTEELYVGDLAVQYAKECYDFVVERNCGIVKEDK